MGAYCSDCYERALHDLAAQYVFKRYVQESDRLRVPSFGNWIGLLGIMGFFVGISFVIQKQQMTLGLVVMAAGVALALVGLRISVDATHKGASKLALTNPGFQEFYDLYRAWRRDRTPMAPTHHITYTARPLFRQGGAAYPATQASVEENNLRAKPEFVINFIKSQAEKDEAEAEAQKAAAKKS